MKNFTNNFKQFTSRLSARWLIMALMLLVGTSTAWGKIIYFEPNKDIWDQAEAHFQAWVWGGSSADAWYTPRKGDVYYEFDLPDDRTGMKLYRRGPSHSDNQHNNNHWNTTGDLTIPKDGNNLFTITDWGAGTWSTYNPCTKPTAPSITINGGSSAKLCSESATITTTEVAGATEYNLYKDDSNTASQTNETGTFTVSEAGTYYVTVTTCDESPKQATGVKLEYYSTPTLNNKYSKTNSTACGSTPHNNGTVTITPAADVTYTLTSGNITYNKVDNTWSNLSPGDYVLTATSTYCADLSVTERIEISNEDKTPTLNDISIKGGESVCQRGNLTLQLNGNPQDGVTYTWYKDSKESEPVGNGSSLNLSNIQNDATYILVASKTSAEGCPASKETSKEITVNPLPAAPALTSPDPVCEGTKVNLPTEGLKWYDAKTGGTEVQNTAIKVTGTYWAAAVQNECESATRTRYDVTVNPKPSIGSITQNVALPVPFEDVVLTATDVTQGAEVKWYKGNNVTPVATGTTYIVTSETTGDVIVKAKAFLGNCESDFKEHKVTFDEENCQGNLSNDIIINFTHPDKDETNKNCQYWGFGKLDYKINGTSQSIDLGKETTETKTIRIENIVASKITDVKFTAHYKFNSCNCEAYTTTIELEKGYEYDVTIEEGDGSGQQSSGSAEKTLVIERSVSLSTQPPLSAPAVKTVSAISVEGSGVVNFVGRVIKTGCAADANIWVGYQYKKKDDVWPTTGITEGTGEKQLVSLGNNKGKVDFSKTIEGLGDGDYHFRAYVINGYGRSSDANNYDQGVYYGIDIPVTVSTKKYPIENLQIEYANDKGEVLQDQNVTYCVGDDAYIKLIYDGSRLKPEDDVINISSTLENTFTLVEGEADLYTFVVKGNETITVNAKNKENTDNPTAELTINTYAVPVIPSIDINQTTICSNDETGAKITVSNPQVGITYQVYKILGENPATTHGTAKKYSEGELVFNSMKEAGTYYVRAYNKQCPNAIAQSLDEILTVIDAAATSISISPETKTVNPWVPVTFTVTKQGNYDYTFSCKEDGNDVTSNMVINRSGDTYVVKFPKPDGVSAATDLNGQVTFADKKYIVEVKLNADVQCGTFNDESEVTLKPVNEICN